MKQKSNCNGRLIVSYADFEAYGAGGRGRIASAIKACERLGFLEVTERGSWQLGVGRASRYRLTYLATTDAPETDEWRSGFENGTTDQFENRTTASGPPVRKSNHGAGSKIELQSTHLSRERSDVRG